MMLIKEHLRCIDHFLHKGISGDLASKPVCVFPLQWERCHSKLSQLVAAKTRCDQSD